jgi:alkylation response protein AidB-like acyl-CoA dehydrogenase
MLISGRKIISVVQNRIGIRSSGSHFRRFKGSSSYSGLDVVSPLIGLTEEQGAFYNLAKSFADTEMKPHASKWDEDSHFPVDTFKKLADLGFAGIFVSEDYNGSGLNR